MRPRKGIGLAPLLAWAMWAVFAVGFTAGILIDNASGPGEIDLLGDISLIVAFGSFATVGAIVASRRPANAIGWIFSSIGVLVGIGALAQFYAESFVSRDVPSPALFAAAAWVASWYWFPLIGMVMILVPMLFPDGSLPSRRWRPLLWVSVCGLGAITLLAALQERIQVFEGGPTLDNPIGIGGLADPEEGLVGAVLGIIGLACIAGACASLVVRFRRSRGEERQQLKWFTYAAGLIPPMVTVESFLLPDVQGTDLFFSLVVASLPIAAAIAIFKYRLYDIDRIINRTLVYGALTAVLGLAYYGIVFTLQSAFGGRMAGSSIAVAASTLGVAALFRPVRGRLQELIDRRFNRRRYDAQRTVEAFSSRLREEVDLETLSSDLLHVVTDTMQPSHASLWLRNRRKDQAVRAGTA